ncbi:MAG TPA: tetratricopeptide repeat protein [Bacteroidia bacterium]|nr:tetratricopeptide repeat protein [Bacteroidia bacterium]
MKRLLLAFAFLLGLASHSFAQNGTDEELAQQYYIDKQYDKAVVYYEKIYAKRPSNYVYHNYLDCLLQTKDYKTAEKTIKKQMHQDPGNLSLWLDMGNAYTLSGDDKSANDSYEKAIKSLTADQSQVLALGQSFIDIKKYDYALETYKKGKDLLKGQYPFLFETAAVYRLMGNTEAMVDTYLDALVISEGFIQSVQDALQISVGENADVAQNNVIRKELLKYIQKYSDNDIFTELLIWMLMQQKNYQDALVQVKALDKRRHEGGVRLMQLASTCLNNEAYDPAIQAYQYVIDMGAKNDNYTQAKEEQLKAIYQKLLATGNYSHEQLIGIQTKFRQGLDELTRYAATVPLMTDLAHLDAFYLHNDSEAVTLMNEAIDFPGLPSVTRARCQMELADILLASGKIWSASLVYSQVEAALKHEPLGDEAKLKNVTIYYYTGNFKWAKSELDILKGATSKLTANDAMSLSLLIADNTDDSAHMQPIILFAHAQLLDFQNYEDSVQILLDSVYRMSNTRTLKEEILMMRGQMAEKKNDTAAAMQYYTEEVKEYPDGMLPDKALYNMAKLEDRKYNKPDKAAEYYKQIILNYPGSLYIEEIRERYRHLSKDDAPPVN